jgi:chromatin remodeling complex protein RSC6
MLFMAKKKAAKKRPAAKKRAPKKAMAKKVIRKKVAKKRTGGPRKGLAQTTYTLSPALASIVGSNKSTRPQIVKKLWVYIKAKKLQDVNNRRMIVPDGKLAEVIGNRPVDMLKLAGFLNKHIK